METIHWLDANSYEGSEPGRLILDRSVDWRRIEHPRFKGWGLEQINQSTAIILSAAEPWWEFQLMDTGAAVKFHYVLAETDFATQLGESLFWCGWDQWGEFDTSRGWKSSACVLGGLPRDLKSNHRPLARFVPWSDPCRDFAWAVNEFAQGSLVIPVGKNSVSEWQQMNMTVPEAFVSELKSVDDWHDAIWEYCSSVEPWQIHSQYRRNLDLLLNMIIDRSQGCLFENVPRWARNTQRLAAQYQRGLKKITEILRRVAV